MKTAAIVSSAGDVIGKALSSVKEKSRDAYRAAVPESLRQVADINNVPFDDLLRKQQAARVVGGAALGAGALSGILALLLSARKSNERRLMDESKARAELPIYLGESKEGGINLSQIPKIPAILAALGVAGLGGGIAMKNGLGSNGDTVVDPLRRVNNMTESINPLSGVANTIADSVREDVYRFRNLTGTIKGDHARSWWNVPWAIPGAVAGTTLAAYGAHKGVNAFVDASRERKLKSKRDKAKQRFMAALAKESRNKLGSVLDEFVETAQEVLPIKEASLLEMYLALLGTAGVLGGSIGFSSGYSQDRSKVKLNTMKRMRDEQLAQRRMREVGIVPDEEPKTGSMDKTAAGAADKALIAAIKFLGKGAYNASKHVGVSGLKPVIAGAGRGVVKNPLVSSLALGAGAAEGIGRWQDEVVGKRHDQNDTRPTVDPDWYTPSRWLINRVTDGRRETDFHGNPRPGTRAFFSTGGDKYMDRQFEWDPMGYINPLNWWDDSRGFGWRFRKIPKDKVKKIQVYDPSKVKKRDMVRVLDALSGDPAINPLNYRESPGRQADEAYIKAMRDK